MKCSNDTSGLEKLLVTIDALDDERLFANGLRLVAVDLAAEWLALENAVTGGEHDSDQDGCPDPILHEVALSVAQKRVSPSISRRWKEWLEVLNRRLIGESWCSFLSAACELVHGPYRDVFEIASRYPERILMCFRRNPDDSIVFEGGYHEIWVTDPQQFAHVFLETVVRDICNGISPLAGIDLPVTLADDFLGRFFNDHGLGAKRLSEAFAVLREEVCCAVIMELSDLSGRARIELAKRGWPEPDHPAPEADSGPRADLSGAPQQKPNAPSAPRGCVWYQTKTGVWNISVPSNPQKIIQLQDLTGLAYIQTVLRAFPLDLSPAQVQFLAGKGNLAATPFDDVSGRFDKSIHDDDGTDAQQANELAARGTPEDVTNERAEREVKKEMASTETELVEAQRQGD